ncbi:hypothetical protein AC579_7060 [Pseudocercospora musae]|uniref:Uncharacterized protein n=1 Tax=Pseudocercospora musae TaxID=113226 RepID=A0A139I1T3_9PEZI|nr:hypothetical protein AC579_7060 [Pseudocercospora musae]
MTGMKYGGLAFTPDHEADEEIELFQARPPQKSLLLVYRQIRNEAKGFYLDTYRKYWRTTPFVVNVPPTRFDDIGSAYFSGEDVHQITRLRATRYRGSISTRTCTFARDQGSWAVLNPDGMPSRYIRLRHLGKSRVIFPAPTKPERTAWPVEPLHKQLLLLIRSYDDEVETWQVLGKLNMKMYYLAQWGSLHRAE